MFKKLFFTALFGVFAVSLFAQKENFKLGVRVGVSTTDIEADDLLITNADAMENLRLGIAEANYGYHLGLFAQMRKKHFFVQPEVLFNSNSVDFKVTDLSSPESSPQILREKYQYLDVPLMLGLKFGALRLQGGPVGHVFLNSSSELIDVAGYEEKFDEFTYGWQAGIGIDFWQFVIDVKYEGNFQNFGNHIVIDGQNYEFDQSPSRFVATLGIDF